MHIKKGKPHFSKSDLWNLDEVLASIIHQGLIQFKESTRNGHPMEAVKDYLINVEKLTEEQVKDRFDKNPNDFDSSLTLAHYEKILDSMIFAFSKEAKKDYYEIVDRPYDIKFLEEEDKGTIRYSQMRSIPKEGKTEADILKYHEDEKKYDEENKAKLKQGLAYFAIYFYSLWD